MDIKRLLSLAYERRDEIVLCLLGDPGIGKTQGIYEFAKEKGCDVVEIIASQILPNEVSGITMPNDETHSMQIYDHARLSSLKDGDILFFDELLQASPQTLSACLTLIQERRMMSGRKLPDVMIVAAANETMMPTRIPEAIRQRFMFYNVKFDFDSYKRYIYDRHKVVVMPKAKDVLENRKTAGSDRTSWNFVTPRSLEKAIMWMESAKNEEDRREIRTAFNDMFDVEYRRLVKTIDECMEECKNSKEGEVKAQIFQALDMDIDYSYVISPESSLYYIMDRLKESGKWNEIQGILEKVVVDEDVAKKWLDED